MSFSLFFDDEEEVTKEQEQKTSKYTTKVSIPHYEPSDYCPAISEMIDVRKYEDMVIAINNSNQPDDVKRFLRLAAARHIVFNFAKIADYYAQADKELQQLMEDSALVLVDFQDAIRDGFVKLDSKMNEIARLSREAEEAEAEDVGEG